MEGYLAQVIIFAGNFAPRSWTFCAGQLLAISQFSAVFSLVGTTYGGNGRTTFGVPDLRGRVPISPGAGPGLPNHILGQQGGSPTVTLTQQQLPTHHHTITPPTVSVQIPVSTDEADQGSPENNFIAPRSSRGAPINRFAAAASTDTFLGAPTATVTGGAATDNTGGSQPVDNMQPWLAINYVFCLEGLFPSRT